MSAIRDITDRKRAQEALQEKTRALEAAQEELVRRERLATLGQLAGGVSHELRNPLGVIKNSVYYLKMVLPEEEGLRKHLAILEREVATATRIISGMLDFARTTPPTRAATDINRLVRDGLERLMAPDSVRIERDLPGLPSHSTRPGSAVLDSFLEPCSDTGRRRANRGPVRWAAGRSREDTGVGSRPAPRRILGTLFDQSKGIDSACHSLRPAEANDGDQSRERRRRGTRFLVEIGRGSPMSTIAAAHRRYRPVLKPPSPRRAGRAVDLDEPRRPRAE